jgi:hypothetical protein
MKFTLTINLGNSAMADAVDVAFSLRSLADELTAIYEDEAGIPVDGGAIRDDNGNTVGRWSLSE